MTEREKMAQCDDVDNAIYNLLKDLCLLAEKKQPDWDIKIISDVREVVQNYYGFDEDRFYPCI